MSNEHSALSERYLKIKRELFDLYYDSLNERQREAVYTVNGPLLVLAGAGSGKTTVLVRRIAHIIKFGDAYFSNSIPSSLSEQDVSNMELLAREYKNAKAKGYDKSALEELKTQIEQELINFPVSPCPAWAILSITFTNKAANEMKERLTALLGEDFGNEIWAGTFHSICVRILRQHGDKIGLKRSFTIYDAEDSKRLIGNCLKELNIDEKVLSVKLLQNVISRAKDKLFTPEDLLETDSDYRTKQIAKVYERYQEHLVSSNALDFDDIIMRTVELLEKDEDTRKYYQRRFKYVCVDEYQDTNHAQFALTALLCGGYFNVMAVGDDDQSIYRFRGATIENILSFDRKFKGTKVVKLEQNYRSTQNILSAANAVIANNTGRKGKTLWTAAGNGSKIKLKRLQDQAMEARFIVNEITRMVRENGKKFSDFAVLYRMNAQSNFLEGAFARSGISYRIIGGLRFYERKEIKDIIAYLSVINNTDDNLRLLRIINEPKRKIGTATIDAVRQIAEHENKSLFEIMKRAGEYTALTKAAPKLSEFVSLIEELIEISKTESLSSLFEKTIVKTGYKDMLLEGGFTELDRLENINELISNAIEFEKNNPEAKLSDFLEEVSLLTDIDNYDQGADAVVLMTIHSAKGLEFNTVFLPGMEDGIFPGIQSQRDSSELEEERRLAYVAITRAKENLYITHAKERVLFGQTQYNKLSQFVEEIPREYIEDLTEAQQSVPAAPVKKTRDKIVEMMMQQRNLKNEKPKEKERFNVGDSVVHITFGRGDVLSVRDMGADVLYEIAFDTVGTKKLMASYAKLKKE